MKLTNVNKLIIGALVLGLYSCHKKTEEAFLIGNWKYIEIQKSGKSFIKVGDNDHLMLNTDSTFEYNIQSLNKHMQGTWTYDAHTLHLRYHSPDTLRHFKINILSKYELRMQEDSLEFILRTAL